MKKIGFITLIFILAVGSLLSQVSRELDYNIVATGTGYGIQGSQFIIELQFKATTTVAELGSGQMRITYNSDAMTLNQGASYINSDIVNYGSGYSYSTDHIYSPATGKIQAGIVYEGGANPANAYDLPTTWLNFAHVVFDITDQSQTSQIAWIETTPETQFYAEDNITSHTNNSFTGDDDTPLPVYLSSFYALYNDDIATLFWTTQIEENNAYWSVYRSISQNLGQAIQLNIDEFIAGAGSTSEPTDYTYTDGYGVEENHTYFYWIESVEYSGETESFGPVSLTIPSEENEIPEIPMVTDLYQNFPNPFNPTTLISFDIDDNETGVLSIYNVKGQLIIKEEFEAGRHYYVWDAKGYSSGIYLYKLQSKYCSKIMKMLLVK